MDLMAQALDFPCSLSLPYSFADSDFLSMLLTYVQLSEAPCMLCGSLQTMQRAVSYFDLCECCLYQQYQHLPVPENKGKLCNVTAHCNCWLGGTTGSASDQRSEGCRFEAY